MKKMFFFTLVLFIGSQFSAGAQGTSFQKVSPSPQSQSASIFKHHLMANSSGQSSIAVPLRSQSFSNLELVINNAGVTKDIWFHNIALDLDYYINVPHGQSDIRLTVDDGYFDVFFVADDNGQYNHSYQAGCSSFYQGVGAVNIYNTLLDNNCYTITCD